MRTARCLLVLLTLLALAADASAEKKKKRRGLPETKPLTAEQAEVYKLDRDFYKKATDVQGILIATSDGVSDMTHAEAAYLFDAMMSRIDQDVAQRVRDKKVLCIIIGHDELTSDVPQFKSDKTGKELDFYNWRSRGFLTWKNGRPTVVFAEEDVLEYEGGMTIESILIHEFGHVIDGAGFSPELKQRLTDAYRKAKEKGLWNDGYASQRFRRVTSEKPVSLRDALVKAFPDQPAALIEKCLAEGDVLVNGEATDSVDVKVTKNDKVRIIFGGPKECYAGKNRAEYWAEGVQSWYDTNRTMDHDHNHIRTREQLKSYDPLLAKLCKDVLGDSSWKFVSPRKRAGKKHLADYDLETAPKVVDPQHIKDAANDYYDKYWSSYWQRLADRHLPKTASGRTTRPSTDEDYEIVDVRGWPFHIHKEYLHGDQKVLENALKNADLQLSHVETLLPAYAVGRLKKVPVWVTPPGKRTAEYHWQRSWLIANGRNPDMCHCVQITDIDILSKTRPTGPWVLLHELAHAWHDREVSKEDWKAIEEAYKKALDKGLYQQVLHLKRRDQKKVKAYAATRMEEYFAETVEAYFGLNDFYPFVRPELEEYDPAIVEIIERTFHVEKKK